MFPIIILAPISIALMVFMITGAAAAGFAFVTVFGDVIVCCLVLGWLINRIVHRKKN